LLALDFLIKKFKRVAKAKLFQKMHTTDLKRKDSIHLNSDELHFPASVTFIFISRKHLFH